MATIELCDSTTTSFGKHAEIYHLHSHQMQLRNFGGTDAFVEDTGPDQDFSRWRPTFHLMAPHGWMNDPCAPGYDPSSGLYYIAFQWNPKGNDWGDITWGHATSPDLVNWTISSRPCLTPTTHYDGCGIFTGCLRPTNINGEADGALTCLYTSVNKLPIHYTLPYSVGCESLSLATSRDGGSTWERFAGNPILPSPPSGVTVTGWRDPFVAPWATVSKLLGRPADSHLYGCISGGVLNEYPTTFLYSINAKNLAEWEYLGPLVNKGLNFRRSRWSGDLGVNWEVTNFVTLSDETDSFRDFVIMGAEGGFASPETSIDGSLIKNPINHQQLWMSGKVQRKDNDSESLAVEMQHDFGGVLDYGCFYAGNSFWDPVLERNVISGWITEDDLPDNLRHRQNWSGLLAIPRVLKLLCIKDVSKARVSKLDDITTFDVEADDHGTYIIRTLGVIPDQRLEKLRKRARPLSLTSFTHQHSLYGWSSFQDRLDIRTLQWEIDSEFTVGRNCKSVGLIIGHSQDLQSRTILAFDPIKETFTIDRLQTPAVDQGVNQSLLSAPHTLLTTRNPATGQETEETLRVRAFFDKSVLEVFVNERTVISTRVYAESRRCYGVRFFAESSSLEQSEAPAVLRRAIAWDELSAA